MLQATVVGHVWATKRIDGLPNGAFLEVEVEGSGDRLVAFDVWWVSDRSPPPGVARGEPLAPEKLLSYGSVTDSAAAPWLGPLQAEQRGRRRPDAPLHGP